MKKVKFKKILSDLILRDEKTTTWRIFDDKDIQTGDIMEFLVSETKEPFAVAKLLMLWKKVLKN